MRGSTPRRLCSSRPLVRSALDYSLVHFNDVPIEYVCQDVGVEEWARARYGVQRAESLELTGRRWRFYALAEQMFPQIPSPQGRVARLCVDRPVTKERFGSLSGCLRYRGLVGMQAASSGRGVPGISPVSDC